MTDRVIWNGRPWTDPARRLVVDFAPFAPTAPLPESNGHAYCPACGDGVDFGSDPRPVTCESCGQALDWAPYQRALAEERTP